MINNLSFKLKDIMSYPIYDTASKSTIDCLKYDTDNNYYEDYTAGEFDFIGIYKQYDKLIKNDNGNYYDVLYDIVLNIYTKYHNYNIAFYMPNEFLFELFLKIKKHLIKYIQQYKLLLKQYNISDNDLYINEITFTASAYNNAISDVNEQNTFLDEFKGYVNEQNGRKIINNKYDKIIKYYNTIKSNTLINIIDDCKTLFVNVIPNEKYLYLEE